MRPETLKNTLKKFHAIRRSALIQGPPGGGKTQVAKQAARELAAELGLEFLDMDMGLRVPAGANPDNYFGFKTHHGPSLQPEDIALPAPTADRTRMTFLITDNYPLDGDVLWPTEGFLLIDELPQADNAIQKTMAHVFQERNLHGNPLKAGWTLFATGNRQSDRSGANRLLSHLRNRVTTLDFETSLDDWINWAIDNDIRPELIGFMKFKPGMLHDFKPEMDINPTPRAWAEGVSPILDNVPIDAEMECIAGAVGEGAASEFKAFLNVYRKLPNPDDVIANPDKHDVPEETSVKYALSSALAYRATTENFGNVMQFMKKMPKEYAVLVALSASRKDCNIQQTKAFIKWAIEDGAGVLI